jgi:hypothetical protein
MDDEPEGLAVMLAAAGSDREPDWEEGIACELDGETWLIGTVGYLPVPFTNETTGGKGVAVECGDETRMDELECFPVMLAAAGNDEETEERDDGRLDKEEEAAWEPDSVTTGYFPVPFRGKTNATDGVAVEETGVGTLIAEISVYFAVTLAADGRDEADNDMEVDRLAERYDAEVVLEPDTAARLLWLPDNVEDTIGKAVGAVLSDAEVVIVFPGRPTNPDDFWGIQHWVSVGALSRVVDTVGTRPRVL